MGNELCEMALMQTQELLRFTDTTLQEICCRKFTDEKLYAEALIKVLGGKGKRGPNSIFIVFQDSDGSSRRGRIFHLKDANLLEKSEEIQIDPTSNFAINLFSTEELYSNWSDSCETIEQFQTFFNPTLRTLVGEPIRNFTISRFSGDPPGAILSLNYSGHATEFDADVMHSLAVVIGSLVTLSNEVRATENAFIYTIEALARACEAAEEGTGHHIQRVNRYAGALAANIGCSTEFVETISNSAQMHDVGKIKVPVSILLKEGPLDRDELSIIQQHPVYGEQILGDSPRLKVAREIAISHHENWDGSGYPYGLKGENIPLAGRIVKIADVYDALRSKRSYKEKLSHGQVLKIFQDGDSRIIPDAHFDPLLLSTFFKIEHIFASIYESLFDGKIA